MVLTSLAPLYTRDGGGELRITPASLCGLPGFNLFSTLTEPELPIIVRLMMIELFGGPS
jgi:hypothetical protein